MHPVTVYDRHVEYLKEEPRKAAPTVGAGGLRVSENSIGIVGLIHVKSDRYKNKLSID